MKKIKFDPNFRAEDPLVLYLIFMGVVFLLAIPFNQGEAKTAAFIMGLGSFVFATPIYIRYHFFEIKRVQPQAEFAYTDLKTRLKGPFNKKINTEDFFVLITLLFAIVFLFVAEYFAFAIAVLCGVVLYVSIHFSPKPALVLHWVQKIYNELLGSNDGPTHLGKIYRKLAKKYHPDRARTLPQKVYFERMMKLVNKAYTEKDIPTLNRLSKEIK